MSPIIMLRGKFDLASYFCLTRSGVWIDLVRESELLLRGLGMISFLVDECWGHPEENMELSSCVLLMAVSIYFRFKLSTIFKSF